MGGWLGQQERSPSELTRPSLLHLFLFASMCLCPSPSTQARFFLLWDPRGSALVLLFRSFWHAKVICSGPEIRIGGVCCLFVGDA